MGAMYTLIPVPVPKGERNWWKKNRTYPAAVELDYESLRARVGERVYQLLPQPDGGYIAAFKAPDRFIEAGRFNEERVYRSLTIGAARDLKALRSAIYNTDYAFVMAVRTPRGLVHAGACAGSLSGALVYTVKDEELETRCLKCGEGFE